MSEFFDRLKDIEARANAATAGPWFDQANDLIGGRCVMPEDATPGVSGQPEVADFCNPHDAEFIAAARTDIPWLLSVIAEIRRLADESRRNYEAGVGLVDSDALYRLLDGEVSS